MSEKLTSLMDKITYPETNNKISFEEFINEKIINNNNFDNEIKKEELIKELEEKVENGSDYFGQIDDYFGDKDNMKLEELQNIINPKEEEEKEVEEEKEEKKSQEEEEKEVAEEEKEGEEEKEVEEQKEEENKEEVKEEEKEEEKEEDKEEVKEEEVKEEEKKEEEIKEEEKVEEKKEEEKKENEIQFEDKKEQEVEIKEEENKKDKIKNINKEEKMIPHSTLDDIYTSKMNSDLDFLSYDLPKDKNREKILSKDYTHNYNLSNRIQTKSKFNFDPELENEINNIKPSNEETIIKPINEFKEYENNINSMNEIKGKTYRENNNNKKSYYKPIQNKILSYNDDFVDKFIQNENFGLDNVVLPINQKKNLIYDDDAISKGVQNIKSKINNNEFTRTAPLMNVGNNNDYFFNLYKDFSNQNRSLSVLDNKVLKITNKQKDYLSSPMVNSPPQPNNLLNKMKMNSNLNNNKNDLFSKFGIKQSNYNNNNLHEYQAKDFNLKDPKDKQKYIESLKSELKQFSLNKDKQKESREKNSAFGEIDERLQKLYIKNKQLNENLDKKQNLNQLGENLENKIQNFEKKFEKKIENKTEDNKIENKIEDNKIKNKIEDNKIENKIEDNKIENKIEDNKIENKIEENNEKKLETFIEKIDNKIEDLNDKIETKGNDNNNEEIKTENPDIKQEENEENKEKENSPKLLSDII